METEPVLESQWMRGQGGSIEMAKTCIGDPGSAKGVLKTYGHQRGVWMA